MFPKRRLFLFLLLILFFVILVNRQRHHGLNSKAPLTPFTKAVIWLYSPLDRLAHGIGHSFSNGWHHYFALVGAAKENAQLRRELAERELRLLSLQEELRMRGEETELKNSTHGFGLEGVTASVIAFDPYAISKTVWISAGSGKGIKNDQPVMSAQGLVGRVIKVEEKSAQVLLLTDPRFAVDVVDVTTRVRALVVGKESQAFLKRYPMLGRLEYLNLGDDIREGDLLITSGLSSIYPKGIPVGTIINVKTDKDSLFQSAAVLPAVDLSKVDLVFVMTGGPPAGSVNK